MKKQLVSLLLSSLFLFGQCELKTSDKIDSKSVNTEIKNRKIKRVTDSEMIQGAFNAGKKIREKVLSTFTPSEASCGLSLEDKLPPELVQLSLQVQFLCESQPDFREQEWQIWNAYQYNLENGLELQENIQNLKDGRILYTYPMLLVKEEKKQLAVLRIILSQKEIIKSL